MLNEKEFFDAMKEELSCLLGDSYKIKMDDCQNVFVKNMMQQKVYRFHGDELFKTYLNGVGMKEICRNVKDCIVMLEPLKEAKTLSFAEAQNHIFMKVINRERHKDILQDVPYLPFLDLAIVAYFKYSSNKSESVPFLINNDILKKWNVKKELVFAKAWENMQRDYRMSIGSIEEAMQAVLLDMPFSGSSIEELELNDCSFHILTNEENKFGFTSVFYPDVLKSMEKSLETSILFRLLFMKLYFFLKRKFRKIGMPKSLQIILGLLTKPKLPQKRFCRIRFIIMMQHYIR